MRDVSSNNFGIVIAYLIPGFVTVWGLSAVIPEIRPLLLTAAGNQPTVGGFLYVTIASIGAGIITSAIRWMLIDTFHHNSGVQRAKWDFSRFHEIGSGYDRLTSLHYDFYQFYSNGFVAVSFAYVMHRLAESEALRLSIESDLGVSFLLVVLYLGSRDTIRKYYGRLDQLMPAQDGVKDNFRTCVRNDENRNVVHVQRVLLARPPRCRSRILPATP